MSSRLIWSVLVVGLALGGCATAPVERTAERLPGGEHAITIEMVRFSFIPDVIKVQAGVPITITGASNSRLPHNITIVTPEGEFLESEDVPANKTVTIRTVLPRPGRYVFYCAKFLHTRFGMEGVFVAQ